MRPLLSPFLLPTLLAAATAAAAPDEPAAPAAADQVRLANGDTVAGDFLGFEPGRGLRFRTKDGGNELVIKSARVDRLLPRPSAARSAAVAADWRITFGNGDSVVGRLAAFTPERLALETPHAGRLEIPTRSLVALSPLAAESAPGALLGPGRTEDWRTLANQPSALFPCFFHLGTYPAKPVPASVVDGILHLHGAGALRDLELKPGSRLDLRLEGTPAFTVAFASAAAPGARETSCCFSFTQDHVAVLEQSREPRRLSSSILGEFPRKAAGKATTLSFLADAGGKRLALAVDGRKVREFPMAVETTGKRLFLHCDDLKGHLALTHLALFPGASGFADTGRGAADAAILSNGDRMEGTLLAIAAGKASFKTAAGTAEIPLERLRAVAFAAGHDPAPAAGPDTVRVRWNDSDRLTAKTETIASGVLAGSIAGAGRVALKIGEAQSLEFDPDARMPCRAPMPPTPTQ